MSDPSGNCVWSGAKGARAVGISAEAGMLSWRERTVAGTAGSAGAGHLQELQVASQVQKLHVSLMKNRCGREERDAPRAVSAFWLGVRGLCPWGEAGG